MKHLNTAFVVLAALFWGLSGGIGGILIENGWDAFVVSFYRGGIGLLFVFIWLLLRPQRSGLSNYRLWFWSAIAGLGVAGNFAFYFISISEGGVAVAASLMYTAPVFVYLASFTLKLEKSTPLKWAAVILVIMGIILLTEVYDINASSLTPMGVLAGLLAGFSYAVFIFGFKFAAPHGSPQAILSIAFTVLAAILVWPSDGNQIVAVLSTQDWLLFAILGVLGAGLSFIIYIIGLKNTAPAVASVVAMAEPVTASLFGVFILNENLAGFQILGVGLILITVTTLSIQSGPMLVDSQSK
ncbi:DMT family transporter [Rhodohalobacter sulfatireducens]|uniref:DMT family transporter n=1 Tax=Rhodohalobacter sulfatireducens TaxID=2911366 RepID=A0ABS9KFT7_9BACT|nr:EamA family transporter [Rhodohalobacter sulfatireducens]MCG2589711.1 DMT family transporter [Rhodohalobacter sulfatireducens]